MSLKLGGDVWMPSQNDEIYIVYALYSAII